MSRSDRTDKSLIGRWWWNLDRWTFFGILALMATGVVLVTAASTAVAERLGLGPFYFVIRHLVLLVPALGIMIALSMAEKKTLWRIASAGLGVSAALIACSILFGPEIKGATRWIQVFGFSLQPSEFAKPFLAVTAAWLIARKKSDPAFPGYALSISAFCVVLALLLLQPDLGMSIVLTAIISVEIFLAGLPMILVFGLIAAGAGGLVLAYLFFPHVAARVDLFLDPSSGDNYQVQKSLDAFANGGLLGTGPGHGEVKLLLPDAHADFIFSVAGEEFGMIATLFLVMLLGFIFLRSLARALSSDDLFVTLAAGGLLTQFALQSFIHMASSLQLLPAKGMTLPFVSYGGSSLLAMAIGMGMLLCLTRKRMPANNAKIVDKRSLHYA
jgi:cell division protein FtsW